MDITEAQNLMKRTYLERDRERGTEATFMWLVEEVGELARCHIKGEGDMRGEMADVLAWLLSLANLMDVDLEAAFVNKYGKGCPRCGSMPCQCRGHIRPG